jgi:hypothetical protein
MESNRLDGWIIRETIGHGIINEISLPYVLVKEHYYSVSSDMEETFNGSEDFIVDDVTSSEKP